MDEQDKEKFKTEVFKRQFRRKNEHMSDKSNIDGQTSDYSYIAKLLLHPVADGRNRLLWLVLAPYTINILKLPFEQASDLITAYLEACNELSPCGEVIQVIDNYLSHAAEVGLFPPHEETLKESDPDMWCLIQDAIGN